MGKKMTWVAAAVVVALVAVVGHRAWNRNDSRYEEVGFILAEPADRTADAAPYGRGETRTVEDAEGVAAPDGKTREVGIVLSEAPSPIPLSIGRKPGEPVRSPPIPSHFPEPPVPQMGWAEARYEFGGRVVTPGNQRGQMALVHVAPGMEIAATIKWPRAVPGTAVALEVVDGGRLEGSQLSMLKQVDGRGEIQFRFTANRQPGRCQVVVRSGTDEMALRFWVAEEMAKNAPAGL